jgi:mannose-P-dolichol utilization defect 1
VYFFFRKDCFDLFFNKFDFSNSECIKITVSKGLGYAIILGSGVLKVPQIIKIIKAGSVEGISKSMFYFETLTLLHAASYSISQNIPFSVYGETLIILVQNVVIILMFWVYSKEISVVEKLVLFLLFNSYGFVLFQGKTYLDDYMWSLVQKSNMILMVGSRIPQIMTNFMNKSTGQLAFFTFILNFLGGLARLATVMVETDDFLYQLQFILGVVLNGIIVIQFLMYWNNSGKAVSEGGASADKTGKPVSSGGQSPSKKRREKVE